MPGSADSVRILLVAGRAETARVLARSLTRLGHAVAVVGGAEAALAAVRSGGFDLLASESELPDATGAELLRRVHPMRGILVASGGEGQIRDAGSVAVLSWPVDAGRLEAAVRDAMRR